jgi:uncharacterized protein (DUF1501 family)
MTKTKPTPAPHTGCAHGCQEYDRLSRRSFLGAAAGAVTSLALPAWLPRVAFAASDDSSRDVLVSIFLRGGADGLTLVPPHGDDAYYDLRPTLAIPRPDSSSPRRAIDLDGFFGLPRAMAPLLPAWQDGALAIIHGTGLPIGSRSHFDAMYFMEVGQVQPPPSLFSGWLGRHLATTPPAAPGAVLRGMGIGYGLQRSLEGGPLTVPVRSPGEVDFYGDGSTRERRQQAIAAMYGQAETSMRLAAANTLATVDLLAQIDFDAYVPAGGAIYPDDDFGLAMKSVAALIKAGVGLEVAAIDLGGWDTHDEQQPFDGNMFFLMDSLSRALAAFHVDLFSDDLTNVVVVAQSEFGRNAFENASGGCDHGTGGAMLVLGGHVNGGQVIHDWPGLAPEQLFEEQDLATTIDYRDVLAEIVTKRLGNPDFRNVFPQPGYTPLDRGVVRAS